MMIKFIQLEKLVKIIEEVLKREAKKLFKEAKAAGANAVKLQKRDNKSLYTKKFYNQIYANPNSYGETYGKHREALEFDFDQY